MAAHIRRHHAVARRSNFLRNARAKPVQLRIAGKPVQQNHQRAFAKLGIAHHLPVKAFIGRYGWRGHGQTLL